ncbi:MAG: phytanoyl-CoA dioxygenase family protein [Proteobacteria bacterium]|jgi:hypothetical protein|nr:phytanoyl-CoA dioxygenase family protein [Pseudomonadota bacterium]MDA1301801.1 phytanoyl-CoA dioxygenase family protein [Pseudomonadota bacterium]
MNEAEKRELYRDGFVVLRNIVSRDLTQRAKELIRQNPTTIVHGDDARINDLYNQSGLAETLEHAMGPHTRPINAQVAVTMPYSNDAVVRGTFKPGQIPPAQAHVDGGWAGPCPIKYSEIKAAGQSLHTWGSDGDPRSMGPAGGAPLWQDRERTLAIGSYTALAAVCLNDQRRPGKGQFAVRRGAHEAVEAYFRMQREQGGPVGGGGPGWPRLKLLGNDTAFAGIMPEAMVNSYPDNPCEMDGWPWPELTPVLMEEGDAVIALHSLPHTATPNLSDDPRMNVLFRIRRLRPDNPYEGDRRIGWGVSDHPDRTLGGEFLDYPDSYDPFRTSIDRLCDHWSEWDGMADIVTQMPGYAGQ